MVANGVKTGIIRPMGRREVSVLIKGLNFNTPDSLVREYLGKHGKVVSDKVIYEKDKDGPFKDLYNGNRRYHIDFTLGKNLGSYHIIDGSKVQVTYAGQHKTCGRCHKTSRDCPGGGVARQCEDRMGRRVTLIDHMREHWEEIRFSPNLFELDLSEVDEFVTEDMEIKDGSNFTPPRKLAEINSEVILSGIVVKNFPAGISEKDLIGALESVGLPENHTGVKIHQTLRNTNVDIENLMSHECYELIDNLNEKIFFKKKIYCKGMIYITSPIKDNNEENDDKDENEAEKSDSHENDGTEEK